MDWIRASAPTEMSSTCIASGYRQVVLSEEEYDEKRMVEAIHKEVVNEEVLGERKPCLYEKFSIFYVGKESFGVVIFSMTCYSHVGSFYSYDPEEQKVVYQSPRSEARLRRRYAVVQKARDASVIGIVVGTLGVSRYLQVIQHVRDMIQRAGRKSYTFVIGKLSPEKLANFAEIELFVLISCPENSLIESKDFYRPIVTPYELYLALSSSTWKNQWITDFSSILSLKLKENTSSDENQPHFSLVTGNLLQPLNIGKEQQVLDENKCSTYHDKDVVKMSEHTQLSTVHRIHSVSSDFHKNKQSWYGLSVIETQTQPALLETGKSGIACQYENETQH
ncbi:hypothetical protein PORY_000167 [Pneumocystis oryctolagi]|uniref:Uncharacterized protein n=1 Tax=Pneumocystis oryctolagi TaxID=42067 RepID=A0ACB7CGL7_9ASCO|nr:hypothetical protein PORY_000167 [Pneumocystis oryctolagi]